MVSDKRSNFAAKMEKMSSKRRLMTILMMTLLLPMAGAAQSDLDVVILGDSNTWIGGDDCDKPQGWNKWFKDALKPASCKSYARSGATWTHTPLTKRNTQENTDVLSDDNVIFNQICRLEEAVDSGIQPLPTLIIIMAGTNDAWFRPQSLNTALDSIVTADCGLLKEAFPQTQIVLLTPLQSVHAGDHIFRAGDIIEACGQRLGLTVIRMDCLGGIDAKKEKIHRYYTTDGTHTSVLGAQRLGTFIAETIVK